MASASVLVDLHGDPFPPVAVNGGAKGVQPSWWGAGGYLFNTTPASPQRKWRPQLLADACRMLPANHHRELLSDARHIYTCGNGVVAGACHKKADYTIGDAWVPQYLGQDSAYRKVAEPYVWLWFRQCELRGLPYTGNRVAWLSSLALDRDGDCFCVLTVDPDTGRPAFQFFEAHRITSPTGVSLVPDGPYKGATMKNGVAYDRFDRPIAYNLVPDNWVWGSTPVYNWLPAWAVIHIFDPRWFTQGRGVPSICYGTFDWYDIGAICDAEKIGVLANSSISIVQKNDTGIHDTTPSEIARRAAAWCEAPGSQACKPHIEMLESGQIRYVQTTGEIQSHKSDRPSSTFNGFLDHILRGAFAGMDWPFEVARDMSSVGGAAVRAVVNQAQRSVNSRQAVLRAAFTNALLYGIANMTDAGELPETVDWFNWGFTTPPKFSVDVGRDRADQRADLAVGTVTLTQIVADNGGDVEAHLRVRARDYKLAMLIAKEEGVPVEVMYEPRQALGGAPIEADQVSEEEQQDPEIVTDGGAEDLT